MVGKGNRGTDTHGTVTTRPGRNADDVLRLSRIRGVLFIVVSLTAVVAGWIGVVTRSVRLTRSVIASCPDAQAASGAARNAQVNADVLTMIGVTLVVSLASLLLFRRNERTELVLLRTANEELSASNDYKETLIRELYHRTKNNMHVIRSMLSLAASDSASPEVADLVLEVGNRVQSLALVHETLHRTHDLSRINLGEYVSELVATIIGTYSAFRERIRIACSTEEVPVCVDIAAPCGLVVSELLSNAARHAFPPGREGMVSIDVRRDGDAGVMLTYADDGKGVPPEFDFDERSCTGIKTLIALVEHQLRGTIRFDGSRGVAVSITFPTGLQGENA